MTLKPASMQWSDDGTLRSLDYGDVYFQAGKGREESDYVFLAGNNLPERFQKLEKEAFYVGELGFGAGLNFLLTADLFLKRAPEAARLVYTSVEKHPIRPEDLARIYQHWEDLSPLSDGILAQYPPAIEGFHTLRFFGGRITLMLAFGDVTDVLPEITGKFDAWFLDGFASRKNPDMWQEALYPLIAERTAAKGTFATYSAVGAMRRSLAAAGFSVKKVKGFGIKWAMSTGVINSDKHLSQRQKKPVQVLGAGIAGCAAAYALAQKGYKVTLIDRHDKVAAETSGNPLAVVYPKMAVDASPAAIFHRHAFCFARETIRRLNLKSWRECGVLHLDTDDETSVLHQKIIARNGYPEDFARYESGKGLFQPSSGMMSPEEFCQKLSDHPNIEKKFLQDAAKIDMDSDITIVALGYESKKMASLSWLPLQSLRGQISMAKAGPASSGLKHIICHDGYITPAFDGFHCFGATFHKEEPSDFSVRPQDHQENLRKLAENLPALGLTIEDITGGRTGYRTTTPDRLPLIGACPDYDAFLKVFSGLRTGQEVMAEKPRIDNLYLSTAFGAHGMTGAVLAGEIIACSIAGDPLPVPGSLMPYLLPERFILRGLKRKEI